MTTFRSAFVLALVAAAASASAPQDARQERITITLLVPADALVEFDGHKTSSRGESRRYETPPLPVGKDHTYTLTVTSRGKAVTRKISVRDGADNTFDFRDSFGSGPQAPEDLQTVSSKATARTAASSVNFRKELNLPFASLTTLGARIDTARRTPDPVALAHSASELAVAEKVSGKTASVTSTQLLKEAAELASLRRQESELQATLQVSNQLAAAQDHISSLQDQIGLAKAQAQADVEARQRNEEPTAAPRQVVVNNYTTQYLDIFVNGNLKTQVTPGATRVITIEHRWNPTVLTAYGNEDVQTWGPRYIWGKFTKYTWNIN